MTRLSLVVIELLGKQQSHSTETALKQAPWMHRWMPGSKTES